jgi:HK97 family phage portal protein
MDALLNLDFVIKNGKGEEVEEHKILDLLFNPNEELPASKIWKHTYLSLLLTGNAYLFKASFGQQVMELHIMHPNKVNPIASEKPGKLLEGYKVSQIDQQNIFLEPEQVIHFIQASTNPLLGSPAFSAIEGVVDLMKAQLDFNLDNVLNGFATRFALFFPEQEDKDTIQELRDRIEEQFSNRTGKRKFTLFGGIDKASFVKLDEGVTDMDFLSGQQQLIRDIGVAFGVPSLLLNDNESSTYNNLVEAEKMFIEKTVFPLMKDICETLTHGLKKQLAKNEYIDFDASKVQSLRKERESKIEIAEKMLHMGVSTDEINRFLGLGLNTGEWKYEPLNAFDMNIPIEDGQKESNKED